MRRGGDATTATKIALRISVVASSCLPAAGAVNSEVNVTANVVRT
jgi:hypothetical protein